MDNIIEMYAIAIMDENNKEWDIDRVPIQIKNIVKNKIKELEDMKGGE